MRSTVARLVDAPTYLARPARQGTYFSYWSGVPGRVRRLYSRPYRSVVAFPTHDGLTVVSVSWPVDEFRAARADIAGSYHRTIAEVAPELAERSTGGRREERWVGTAVPPLPPPVRGRLGAGRRRRLPEGPVTAQGMTDAFHTPSCSPTALDAGLRGESALDDTLADYQRRRDAAVLPMYEFTCARAGLEPAPLQMQALLGALRDDPTAIERFFGIFAGTVPVQEFFGPPAQAA